VASGLNTKRKGMIRLFKMITKGKISEVIVTYSDRLTRFGFGYLERFFASYGVKIIVIETREISSVQQEMTDDLIAIITSFSGKLHGMRGRKKKKNESTGSEAQSFSLKHHPYNFYILNASYIYGRSQIDSDLNAARNIVLRSKKYRLIP